MYIFPPEGQTRGIKQKEATTVQRIPLCRGLGLALSLSLAVSFTISAYSAGGERASSAPIAQNLTLSTYKNLSVSGQFAATDPENDVLRFQITSQPARGSVTLSDDVTGEFLYTPYDRKTGADSFTYVAIDAEGNVSSPATVKVSIEKAKNAMNYVDLEGSGVAALAQRLADADVFLGMEIGGNSYFRPEETVTRSEFLAMAMTACDCDLLTDVNTTGFADDGAIQTWAKAYCATALRDGYISGLRDGEGQIVFSPDSAISSAQAAVILDNILSLTDASQEAFAQNDEAVPAWAAQSVANLASCGIPCSASDAPLTRGEAAEMLCRAMDTLTARNTGTWW